MESHELSVFSQGLQPTGDHMLQERYGRLHQLDG